MCFIAKSEGSGSGSDQKVFFLVFKNFQIIVTFHLDYSVGCSRQSHCSRPAQAEVPQPTQRKESPWDLKFKKTIRSHSLQRCLPPAETATHCLYIMYFDTGKGGRGEGGEQERRLQGQ
jgi:hypothetical protein